MDHFEEIRIIWQNQKTELLPPVSGINKAIEGYHRKRKRNTLFLVLLSVLCLGSMVYVMVDYKSNLWETRIGEVLFILLGFYLLISKLRLLKKNRQEELLSNVDYLSELQSQSKQEVVNGSRPIPFILACIALCFYTYEMLSVNKTHLIIGYAVLCIFPFLVWFIYRPIMIKRKQKDIQILLDRIDNIKNQTDEKD